MCGSLFMAVRVMVLRRASAPEKRDKRECTLNARLFRSRHYVFPNHGLPLLPTITLAKNQEKKPARKQCKNLICYNHLIAFL